MRIKIREIRSDEWDDMMALVWRTFLKFEAPEFEQEGIDSFFDFVSDVRLEKLHAIGEFPVLGAFADSEADSGAQDGAMREKMVGVIALRGGCHISLLFVDAAYQKKGIGRMLTGEMEAYVVSQTTREYLTVNSAPYAVEFYHRLGFEDTEPQKRQDGIIFTPMRKLLR